MEVAGREKGMQTTLYYATTLQTTNPADKTATPRFAIHTTLVTVIAKNMHFVAFHCVSQT